MFDILDQFRLSVSCAHNRAQLLLAATGIMMML
jgi:hypothetical protein